MTLGELNRSLRYCKKCNSHNYTVIHEINLDSYVQSYRLRCNVCRRETFFNELSPESNIVFDLLNDWEMIDALHEQRQEEAKDGSPRKEENKDLSKFKVEE